MPTLVGYYAHDGEVGRRSRAAAFAFGAPVVWGHPTVAPGRTVSEATARRIPWLYTECPGRRLAAPGYGRALRAWCHQRDAPIRDAAGAKPEREPPHYHLYGSGRIEDALAARSSGFLLPAVRLLDRVQRGDLLGQVLGLAGEVHEELHANADGVLIFMRTTPSVSPGDLAFMVTGEARRRRAARLAFLSHSRVHARI